MKLDSADVVIIGAGGNGASAAYHLCKAGITNVVVVDKDYPGAGSTGRCGGGMRQQWSSPGNVKLSQLSISKFKHFHEEIGQDIEFEEGGYILPAFNAQMEIDFKENIKIQNSLGVPSEYVGVDRIKEIGPILNTESMVGAAYCANDGKANPFLFVKGYMERAQEMGARLHKGTKVTGFKIDGDRIVAVRTDKGKIYAGTVINVAGGYAQEIAAMAGIEIPIVPYRHQCLVTEPIEHCFDPMFINVQESLYFSQTKHGSFVMGQTDKYEVPGANYKEDWHFQVEVARKLLKFAPCLKNLKIVRHWAGLYAMTPDRQPIIGKYSEFDNFLIAAGYSGHGFMHAPATGEILRDLIVKGSTEIADMSEYDISRFQKGNYKIEANVV